MQKMDAKSQPKVSGEMIHISSSTPRDSQRNTAIDETFAPASKRGIERPSLKITRERTTTNAHEKKAQSKPAHKQATRRLPSPSFTKVNVHTLFGRSPWKNITTRRAEI
jgi:hypothetical protein